MYIDKLDDIVNKYSNTYHSKINMKRVDVKLSTNIGFDKKNDKEDPKFRAGNNVRLSKYKNMFGKGYILNWSEEIFVITKIKNTVLGTYVISELNGEEIVGTFFEKEFKKQIKKS